MDHGSPTVYCSINFSDLADLGICLPSLRQLSFSLTYSVTLASIIAVLNRSPDLVVLEIDKGALYITVAEWVILGMPLRDLNRLPRLHQLSIRCGDWIASTCPNLFIKKATQLSTLSVDAHVTNGEVSNPTLALLATASRARTLRELTIYDKDLVRFFDCAGGGR